MSYTGLPQMPCTARASQAPATDPVDVTASLVYHQQHRSRRPRQPAQAGRGDAESHFGNGSGGGRLHDRQGRAGLQRPERAGHQRRGHADRACRHAQVRGVDSRREACPSR
ncbi:MAG: hypothetical protein MZV70_42550 [Desulfobacterales bacterium]|nr:hypothetical protein [Desulfobacterales bacterium]